MGKIKKTLRSDRNIKWLEEHCRIPEGKYVGEKLKLTKEQKEWLREIYDSPTRTFILSLGRKNAKTTFAAFLLLLHLCGPEAKRNSQLYSDAQSREQASILFQLAAKMVRMSPDLNAFLTIRDTAKQLLCPELGTAYRALSADASTAYGLSPAFCVHDELGQVKGPRSDLYEALETAAAAQEEPLSLTISTQAPTDADLLSLLIDDAISGEDPKVKVRFYTCPEEDDPFTEKSIRKANPHYDIFMNKEEVMRQAAEAQRMPSREAAYRNLILNQRVEADAPFVTRTLWLENTGEPFDSLDGIPVFGGLDLSSVNDLTALTLGGKNRNGIWDVESHFWLPGENIIEKSRGDRVPYDVWAQQGYLNLSPGRAIEYEYIAQVLRGVFDTYNIIAIGFDRYNMKFLIPWLEKEGFTEAELEKFIPFGQGFISMSPAIRELESILLQKKMAHQAHPVLTMCAANARIVKDPADNRKFTKQKISGRIDGMVALATMVGVSIEKELETEMPGIAILG